MISYYSGFGILRSVYYYYFIDGHRWYFVSSVLLSPGIEVQMCMDDTCSGRGLCKMNSNGGVVCLCDFGFTGPDCSSAIFFCANSPCENGGTCTEVPGGYECSCTEPWTGQSCGTGKHRCGSALYLIELGEIYGSQRGSHPSWTKVFVKVTLWGFNRRLNNNNINIIICLLSLWCWCESRVDRLKVAYPYHIVSESWTLNIRLYAPVHMRWQILAMLVMVVINQQTTIYVTS